MAASSAETLIRTYLDAFNTRDSEAMLALLSEDVIHDINQGGREIGREKLRWFHAKRSEYFDERLGDVVIMVSEGGNRAAAEFTVRGTYRKSADGLPAASGQSYSLPAGIFFEIDDGLISRVSDYCNLQEWIRQVDTAGA